MKMTRDDLLCWLHEDMMRAYQDAKQRLDKDEYDIGDGLFTSVDVKAYTKDAKKVGKSYRVGHAVNLRVWRDEP